jgi:hypothetical protein
VASILDLIAIELDGDEAFTAILTEAVNGGDLMRIINLAHAGRKIKRQRLERLRKAIAAIDKLK